jgi:peptidoglycan/LPS O-acetylase OafA/YrhL
MYDRASRGAGDPRRSAMFLLQDMVIDALVIVAIMISALIFAYVLTAIIGEWRSQRRARNGERRQRAARQAWDRARSAR